MIYRCLHDGDLPGSLEQAYAETREAFYGMAREIDRRTEGLRGGRAYTSRVESMLVVDPCGCVSRCLVEVDAHDLGFTVARMV